MDKNQTQTVENQLPTAELVLPAEKINTDIGHCWTFDVIDTFGIGDIAAGLVQSGLQLFEDGSPLGPGHAAHARVRQYGRGLYSHWNGTLYFSTSDNSSPASNGRTYLAKGPLQPGRRHDEEQVGVVETEPPLFPRLERMREQLAAKSLSGLVSSDSAGKNPVARIRLLEAKVEYLLDELYSLKSLVRWHKSESEMLTALHQKQIETFNFQWRRLPYQHNFLSNPEWREKAAGDLCRRVERDPVWFAGKKVLDCGCGPGRHAWTFASLGAEVDAFDTSENGLADARKECERFPSVTIGSHDILNPLPYPSDYDLVWSYGVLHCTGDTFGGLKNIAKHVRPGGMIYFMVYAEPGRKDVGEYVYYHEVMAMRQALTCVSLEERARVLSLVEGREYALGWFDAVSSQINDLYTQEELFQMLDHLGFRDIRRTALQERNLNITAIKQFQS